MTDPYNKRDADLARQEGIAVWGCWWCLNEMNPGANNNRPYWRAEDCVIVGHRNACPKHKDPANRRLP